MNSQPPRQPPGLLRKTLPFLGGLLGFITGAGIAVGAVVLSFQFDEPGGVGKIGEYLGALASFGALGALAGTFIGWNIGRWAADC
jgi:hypothetical protein